MIVASLIYMFLGLVIAVFVRRRFGDDCTPNVMAAIVFVWPLPFTTAVIKYIWSKLNG